VDHNVGAGNRGVDGGAIGDVAEDVAKAQPRRSALDHGHVVATRL
jgi:hypothetical protein